MKEIENVVNIKEMCLTEGLSKGDVTENLGLRTLMNALEKFLPTPDLTTTSRDSVHEIILNHLLKNLSKEVRERFSGITKHTDAQDEYFSAEQNSIEEHAAFALWVKLAPGKTAIRMALKIAPHRSLQYVLALQKLATFYQRKK